MNLEFFTGKAGGHRFTYPDRDAAFARYQSLCWWVEFVGEYWTSSLVSDPSITRDKVEYSLLNDHFKRVGERGFHPKDVFSVM